MQRYFKKQLRVRFEFAKYPRFALDSTVEVAQSHISLKKYKKSFHMILNNSCSRTGGDRYVAQAV